MLNKLPRIKMLHTGLALIALTLSLEFVYLGCLGGFLDQADRQIDIASRPFLFAAKAAETIKLFYKCTSVLFAMGYSKDHAQFDEIYEKAAASLKKQSASLADFVDATPGTSKELTSEVRKLGESAIASLDDTRMLLNKQNKIRLFEAQRILSNSIAIFERYFSRLTKAIAVDANARQARVVAEGASRKSIKAMIVIGFLLNALLPLLAVIFWIRGVINRLDVLAENARLLERGKPLLPLQGGQDEIADLEQSFHAANAKLRETAELKRQFTTLLSQELRQPLGVINATLSYAENGGMEQMNTQGRNRFRRAALSSRRLLNIINDLVDLYDLESGKFSVSLKESNLADVLQLAVEEMTPLTTEKKVKIQTTCEVGSVQCDPDRLAQVVINFLSNAVKYSPPNSVIHLCAQEIENEIVEVRVTDQGTGIPEEFLGKLFARYEQSATAVGGTGLGLFICKSIVEQHSGSIGAENSATGGATFWFRIPRHHDRKESQVPI